MNKLLIASNNNHKIKEIKHIFQSLDLEVLSYKEVLGQTIDVVEDGKTFVENALKKVKVFPEKPDCIYLADDSGLEVNYLNGAPGIHSARYAGGDTSTNALCTKLLEALEGVKDRTAQFRCVIALRFPGQKYEIVEGIVKGEIIEKMQGENGFGYDPIFVLEGYKTTYAQMEDYEKNKLSHRYRALMFAKEKIHFYLSQA